MTFLKGSVGDHITAIAAEFFLAKLIGGHFYVRGCFVNFLQSYYGRRHAVSVPLLFSRHRDLPSCLLCNLAHGYPEPAILPLFYMQKASRIYNMNAEVDQWSVSCAVNPVSCSAPPPADAPQPPHVLHHQKHCPRLMRSHPHRWKWNLKCRIPEIQAFTQTQSLESVEHMHATFMKMLAGVRPNELAPATSSIKA